MEMTGPPCTWRRITDTSRLRSYYSRMARFGIARTRTATRLSGWHQRVTTPKSPKYCRRDLLRGPSVREYGTTRREWVTVGVVEGLLLYMRVNGVSHHYCLAMIAAVHSGRLRCMK